LILKTKQPKAKLADILKKGLAVRKVEDYRTESQKALRELERLAAKYEIAKEENTVGVK